MSKSSGLSKAIKTSQICDKCSESFQFLFQKNKIMTRENQSLVFMMEFKDSALKNREEIINKIVHENQSLIEEIKKLKEALKKGVSPIPVSLTKNQSLFIRNERRQAFKFQTKSPIHFIPSIKTHRSSSTEIKIRSNSTSYQRNNESHQIRKITQFSGFLIIFHINNHFFYIFFFFILPKGIETVTESQGAPQYHTLINNREGRKSIISPEEMKQLDQTGLKKLESWIFASDGLKISLDVKEQIDLQENLKSFFCDFKRAIKNCANLKKCIKSIFSMVGSLDLELNFQRIMSETCDVLSCEKVFLMFELFIYLMKV